MIIQSFERACQDKKQGFSEAHNNNRAYPKRFLNLNIQRQEIHPILRKSFSVRKVAK